MFLSTAILLAVIFASPVWAHLSMAQCAAGFDWNRNFLGQDPCTVGSTLDASCHGLTEYAYPPINSTEYYLPPMANNPGDLACDCNSVMYSLYMACASCQGGEVYSWTKWTEQCASVHVSQYPANVPQRTTVPRWAYYDVTLLPNQMWNGSIAMNTGLHPEVLLQRAESSSLIPPSPTTPPVYATPGKMTIIKDSTTPPNPQQPTPNLPPPNPNPQQPTPDPPKPTPNPPQPTPNPPQPTPNPPQPNTNSPEPPVPSDNPNSPEPTTPISINDTVNLPQPTDATGDTSLPQPTDNSGASRPTNPTSRTSSSRPPNPTATTLPIPTNALNTATKVGTNRWVAVLVLFVWTLV